MNDEKKPESISRRRFLNKLALAAIPVAGAGFGANKQWVQNEGATPEALALESILARVKKHRPDGINPENALFVISTYREAITAAHSESDEAKQAAFRAVLTEVDSGRIIITPENAKDVIGKYEKKLTDLRKENVKNTVSYGAIGLAASAVAALASEPSAVANPSIQAPSTIIGDSSPAL